LIQLKLLLKIKGKDKNLRPLLYLWIYRIRNLEYWRKPAKTSYIKALSFAVISKNIDLQSLVNKTPLQVREELIKIKGIGNWTDVYLMFCLQALICPAGRCCSSKYHKRIA
jgi:DNA-3-methyladenine glycosylase II